MTINQPPTLPEDHDLRCESCNKLTDVMSFKLNDDMRYPVMPNTLTDLPDHNNVIWKCPHCGLWNNQEDEP